MNYYHMKRQVHVRLSICNFELLTVTEELAGLRLIQTDPVQPVDFLA